MSKLLPRCRRLLHFTLLLLLPACPLLADARSPADAALQEGRIDQAVAMLRSSLAARPDDALSHNLLCRAFYAEDRPDDAVPECEAAVAHAPSSSSFALWLGRAYGMKAEHSGPITGYSMAKRVRAMFERAVSLDPKDPKAMSDLGEFYVNAPSIVGGDYDKAAQLATQLQPVSRERSHRLLAQIAEKRGDYTTAESEFKAAAASHTSAATVDLGLFYHRRKRYNQAVATLRSAAELDRDADANLVDIAGGLNDMKREPEFSIQILRRYLDSPARSEVAPAIRVHVLLGRILARIGDASAARQQFQAALALAANYAPARSELDKLPSS